ncbi:MAG: hypothetical protein AAGF12_10740 [Myxococcota bacterium]
MPASLAEISLTDIARQLEADGYDARELLDLQTELDALESPPGLLRRVSGRAKELVARQWGNMMGEVRESAEVVMLLRKAAKKQPLSAEERDKVRAQLFDLVKIVPAGLIAAANSALPIPGTSVLTPWLLSRMNLLPSNWREAHLLDRLHKHQLRLEETGRPAMARKIAQLVGEIEADVERRDAIARSARLLTHWDANDNGVWDPEEREAYLVEVERLRDLAQRFGARKRWFIEHSGEVYGAVRLTEVERSEDGEEDNLVCFDGKTGWVALPHVLGEEPDFLSMS